MYSCFQQGKTKRNKHNAYFQLIIGEIRKETHALTVVGACMMNLPGLCVANKAPADTEVTRKLLKRSPRNASQRAAARSKKKAPVFLS